MLTQDTLFYVFIALVVGICFYMYFIDRDKLELKCVVSGIDGNTYCVRDRAKVKEAADLLAKVTTNLKKLVEYVGKKHPEREDVKQLVQNFNPEKVMETLPTSSYTAYSENKGQKIAFCLTPKKNKNENELIDEHTLTFVAIHELAHVGTKSIGHKSDFWENFKFLLEEAKAAGIHEPRDYKTQPEKYCSMDINDNPYYDM